MGGSFSSSNIADFVTNQTNDSDYRYKFHPSLRAAEDWYPQPHPTRVKKCDIFDPSMLIYAARKIYDMDDTHLNDYDDLVSHITKDCISDMEKLCAILAFIGLECLGDRKLDNRVRRETPRAYIKSIRQGYGRYAYFFTILCRKAGIACVLIPGVAKTTHYCTGDKDVTHLRNVWTAVNISGDWRFVHPSWAFQTPPEYQQRIQRPSGEEGNCLGDEPFMNILNRVNDFWFFTDADTFVTFCFPDDARWQLVTNNMNAEQFWQQIHATDDFYKLGLRVLNHNLCYIQTSSGFVEITLQVQESTLASFTVSYDFTRRTTGEIIDDNIPHCVALIKDFPLVKLKLRLPFADSFLMRIFGSDAQKPMRLHLLCSFRIDCSKAIKYFMPFPESPYYGWGPGYETVRCGVTALTHKSGLVTVESGKPFVMRFQLQKFVELIADLLTEDDTYEPSFSKQGDDVNMLVKLPPVNKEYGLVLYAKNTHSGFFCNAVNYIIRRNVTKENSQSTNGNSTISDNLAHKYK